MTASPDADAGVVPEWTTGWRLQRSLAHARIQAGDMAAELQVSRATVSRWLNDKGLPPRSVYLRRWADLTGVPFLWLCHGDARPCGPGGTAVARIGGGVKNNGRSGRFNLTTNLTPDLGLAA